MMRERQSERNRQAVALPAEAEGQTSAHTRFAKLDVASV